MDFSIGIAFRKLLDTRKLNYVLIYVPIVGYAIKEASVDISPFCYIILFLIDLSENLYQLLPLKGLVVLYALTFGNVS